MGRLSRPFVKCEQNNELCFAYKEGKCVILKSTEFSSFCPFYKTRKEFNDEREEYGKEKDTETY